MRSKIFILLLSFITVVSKVNSQDLLLDTLTWDSFTDIVKTYHPVTTQAKLLTDLAKAKRLQALGANIKRIND
mgnify:CR=1 FL=1